MTGIRQFAAIRLALVVVAAIVVSAHAVARIEVDNKDVDLGAFREGETKKVRHEFKIKNTGDEPLVLREVRPG